MVGKQNKIVFLLHLNLYLLKYAMCDVTKWSLWDGQPIEWSEGEKQHSITRKTNNLIGVAIPECLKNIS